MGEAARKKIEDFEAGIITEVADNRKTINTRLKKLVSVARELFFRFGIRRVSVEEICRKANVSKMTFYKYFKNKDDIAIHIIDSMYGRAFKEIDAIMAQDTPFDDRMKQLMAYKIKLAKDFSKEFIKEIMMDMDSECGRFLAKKKEETYGKARQIYSEAQKKGEIRQDIKIDFIMYMMDNIGKLFAEKYILDMYPDMTDLMNDVFNMVFYGLLERKK